MTASSQSSTLVRGADGYLYSIDDQGCRLVDETKATATAVQNSLRSQHNDYDAGRMVIEAGDHNASRMVIEADDYDAGRMVIEAGDHKAARMVIEAQGL
ncbi:MAG: hypothetical protein MI785_25400 [Kiloniellales bacterium]|nr:hypothetical protein [Kiloniellales bacterium]